MKITKIIIALAIALPAAFSPLASVEAQTLRPGNFYNLNEYHDYLYNQNFYPVNKRVKVYSPPKARLSSTRNYQTSPSYYPSYYRTNTNRKPAYVGTSGYLARTNNLQKPKNTCFGTYIKSNPATLVHQDCYRKTDYNDYSNQIWNNLRQQNPRTLVRNINVPAGLRWRNGPSTIIFDSNWRPR